MGDDRSFDVRPISTLTDVEIAATVSEMYGEPRSESWLRWKHQEGPWGRSTGFAVCDTDGILGLAFSLPWQWRVGDHVIAGARLIDGGSIARARGKGVFRTQVQAMLDDFHPLREPVIATATATPEAAASHVKLGATLLAPIRHAYCTLPGVRSARLVRGDEALASLEPAEPPDKLTTDWTPDSMRWRIDGRSGYAYEVASLAQSDAANGVVYRATTVRGRLRVVVIIHSWGPALERRRLFAAAAREHRCLAILRPAGDGAATAAGTPVLYRGESHLCVWNLDDDRGERSRARPALRTGWALANAELEGTM